MSLRRVNLNLLPVLQTLLRERSVSRAAEIMGMSQSAASDALMRLRHALGDELLVRVGSRMEPTARAVELMPSLAALCDHMEEFVSDKRFDPLIADRKFVISTSDYLAFLLAGPLLRMMEIIAPHVSLRFVDETDNLPSLLATRGIDLAIMPSLFLEELAPAQLKFRHLLQERGTVLLRQGHPLSHLETVSVADLIPYRTILYHPGYTLVERRHSGLFMGGQSFMIAANMTDLTLIPHVLVETDYFSILPSRLARRMVAQLPLQIKGPSFEQETMEIGMAWGPVQDNDVAHRWFRDLIMKWARGLDTIAQVDANVDANGDANGDAHIDAHV